MTVLFLKMKLLVFVMALLAVGATEVSQKVRYDNYRVYRLTPKDEQAFQLLKQMEEVEISDYDFWSHVVSVGSPVDVLVPPHT
ncbi:hypothetical protein NQ317_014694 [Molorchus minor]|uniref:Carboxypeptidase activation peptide domain-containing protein n=1 Tax=Molorchus minor TaxID=1323400 RepID=A0ABQ9JII1_9CUCU|nr:hypothetical protein NQ317_014694 [Molorchus minor]